MRSPWKPLYSVPNHRVTCIEILFVLNLLLSSVFHKSFDLIVVMICCSVKFILCNSMPSLSWSASSPPSHHVQTSWLTLLAPLLPGNMYYTIHFRFCTTPSLTMSVWLVYNRMEHHLKWGWCGETIPLYLLKS